MECGSGSHGQEQRRFSWVFEDGICSVVWPVGVWGAGLEWKGVDLAHSMCNSRESGKGRNTSPLWVDEFLTVGWVDLEVPQDLRNAGQVWGFFSCWSCHRKCSGAEECLGFLAPRSGEGQTAPGFSLAKCCSTSGYLFGDSAREWGCVYPIPMQLFHAGQQLQAGRGAHSFPTRCVSFDLVKSTLSKAKLFGKKIKPDSLTNWKWGKSSVTVNAGCALYCILLFSKLNHSFLCVYIYR